MTRREFLEASTSVAAFPAGAVAAAKWKPVPPLPATSSSLVWDQLHQIRWVLSDPLEHPFYWWPRTLLGYPIEFREAIDLNRLVLTRSDTGERVPVQFSEVVRDHEGLRSATLHFFSDLPSGGRREFILTAGEAPARVTPSQVSEKTEGNTLVLDSGVMRVRIPASQEVHGDAPSPILQVSRGGPWVGSSKLSLAGDRVTRITARRLAPGPLFITYELAYETAGGSRYIATVQCTGGLDFVGCKENMEGLAPEAQGAIETTWTGFGVTHRQAPGHPYFLPTKILPDYDDYAWEPIDQHWMNTQHGVVNGIAEDGELPFGLGVYEPWAALRVGTFANFWDQHSGDALGVFIDKVGEWQDHDYAIQMSSPTLQVRYYYKDGRFRWRWPLARGRRSTCVTFYDHAKDQQVMHQLEQDHRGVEYKGARYSTNFMYSSHALFLQNRYGTLHLNCVKDWVLTYPETGREPEAIFSEGVIKTAAELEHRVMATYFTNDAPVSGTRLRSAFNPVATREIQNLWIDGYNRLRGSLTRQQRTRLTAMYLFMAYLHAGEDYMPLIPMLGGNPNYLADVKSVPPCMAFLFPDHPQAAVWADLWQKYVELNTHYHTRPTVHSWDAHGGRWTENLGTYVWASLRPALRADYLLRRLDGVERFTSPEAAEIADWLVNALSAPIRGESSEEAYRIRRLETDLNSWGVVRPGEGPRRVHPPQGAHSEQRIPARLLWYMGTCLERYAPLAAEHAMWASRPTDDDMEPPPDQPQPWTVMYDGPDNRGTNPHLRSRKYTGYGIVLRAAVDTPNEVSVHLEQIDEGPNYRWGIAGKGGCGVIYFYAGGRAYSYNGREDVGDRPDQDTDLCSNFGVYKEHAFRSIGRNMLTQPVYDLGVAQFCEILPRQEPSSYSAPEYEGRSILLAGHDYFVVADWVFNAEVAHRLSWFVRRGNELPTLKLVQGTPGHGQTWAHRTEVQTEMSSGVWFDGTGDSLALVSHRKDLDAKATPFGCHVCADGVDDLVFRTHQPVEYDESDITFAGTAGVVRKVKDGYEFALFHGTQIGVPGIAFRTTDTDLGIGGAIIAGQAPAGEYYAPKACSLKMNVPAASSRTVFYVDGAAKPAHREGETITVELESGLHHWELTDKLPVPRAPRIARTENHAGGARVIIEPVAAATSYRVELSADGGATWSSPPTAPSTAAFAGFKVSGLTNGKKCHVRAIALNADHESKPGLEYPLYVTDQAPPAPDGLRVKLAEGAATVSWGEVLGVSEYRLYARAAAASEPQVVYHGLERTFRHQHAGIKPAGTPGSPTEGAAIIQYWVTALNGNGESAKSRPADTNPASWRNFDPMPGEPFRRSYLYEAPAGEPYPRSYFYEPPPGAPLTGPRYYPR